jgi:hypothetical protein
VFDWFFLGNFGLKTLRKLHESRRKTN